MMPYVSAVTVAVRDMPRAVAFYVILRFDVVYGGPEATFSSLRLGDAYVNLILRPDYTPVWWGRVIFGGFGIGKFTGWSVTTPIKSSSTIRLAMSLSCIKSVRAAATNLRAPRRLLYTEPTGHGAGASMHAVTPIYVEKAM